MLRNAAGEWKNHKKTDKKQLSHNRQNKWDSKVLERQGLTTIVPFVPFEQATSGTAKLFSNKDL